MGGRDLGTHPERVTPLVRGAPWPHGVDAAQIYSFQDEGDLEARLHGMRRTARQIADVLVDFGRDPSSLASHRQRHQVSGPW